MNLEWNKVTWYSKLAAVVFFLLVLPIWTFFLGRWYQEAVLYAQVGSEFEIMPIVKVETYRTTSTTQNTATVSGIQGTVTIGPTCPVQRVDDPTCNDKPYSTHLKVFTKDGDLVTETFTSTNGTFTLFLKPGVYMIYPADQTTMPHAPATQVTVEKNALTAVHISFDSGIR